MARVFIPYTDEKPSTVDINGHRIVIVGSDKDGMKQFLSEVGANRMEQVDVEYDGGSEEEREDAVMEHLVHSVRLEDYASGIVLAPPGIELSVMLEGLRDELPWIH